MALRVPFLVHTYSHRSHFFCLYVRLFLMAPVPVHSQFIPLRTFIFTLITLKLLIFLFLLMDVYDFRAYVFKKKFKVYLYSHWVHSCWSSVLISTFTWSYHKVPTGNKGSTILTGNTGMGSWQNCQGLNRDMGNK